MLSPAVVFLLILVIGFAIGILIYGYAGSNWINQLTGTRRGQLTSGLVGVAGAFLGYHLAVILGLLGAVALLIAAVCSAALVWIWRTVRI